MNALPLLPAALAAGSLLTASQADAHARLLRADPAANAVVAAPQEVALHFSENLVALYSGFTLRKADGTAVPVVITVSKTDPKTLIGKPKAVFATGSYQINWRVVAADDGHRTTGDLKFVVR